MRTFTKEIDLLKNLYWKLNAARDKKLQIKENVIIVNILTIHNLFNTFNK